MLYIYLVGSVFVLYQCWGLRQQLGLQHGAWVDGQIQSESGADYLLHCFGHLFLTGCPSLGCAISQWWWLPCYRDHLNSQHASSVSHWKFCLLVSHSVCWGQCPRLRRYCCWCWWWRNRGFPLSPKHIPSGIFIIVICFRLIKVAKDPISLNDRLVSGIVPSRTIRVMDQWQIIVPSGHYF